MAATKFVFFFGNGKADGKSHQRNLLGGKGAGLAEMTHLGLPVPAGFTISTECCQRYYRDGKRWPDGLEKQVKQNLGKLERAAKKKFGHKKNPLLMSVRSGASVSMPGMMETILNLGLNDETIEGLAAAAGNRRFALDGYRRLIMMFGSTAMGVRREEFDEAFDRLKDGPTRARLDRPQDELVLDTDVNEEELSRLIWDYKDIYQRHVGSPFPQDPWEQLVGSINAVFGSWMADKAVTYRRVENLSSLQGTAVNVQQMVFGNMGDDSGTGVCFTRDPSSGENVFYGDLLINAQGEDVVAGIRTPIHLSELNRLMPDVYMQLEAVRAKLELQYKDMQDLEFTIEQGKLYMLQTRTGKRTPTAAFRIAVEQATKPLLTKAEVGRLTKKRLLPKSLAKQAVKPVLTKEEAIRRIKPADIERLFYPVIDSAVPADELDKRRVARGIDAVPGAAAGEIVFTAAAAESLAASGRKAILVRKETSPEDVGGMFAASGILTATGGKTSHAAVVARGWGKCCIVGCGALKIDYSQNSMSVNGRQFRQGDWMTLDGSSGTVYEGQLPLSTPTLPAEYETLMSWCDKLRGLRVRTNADTPSDAAKAVEMGAEGIGLCRTEHMFFKELGAEFSPDEAARRTEDRQLAIQAMIIAESKADRQRALDRLLPFQRDDFRGIFEAMDGRPVTIRLVDPPLHEFLPSTDEQVKKLSAATGVSTEAIRHRAEQLHESNPMLGHRGCRLCITYPEILDMQVRAIIEAAIACRENGKPVSPEIMIPLSIDREELRILTTRVREVADRVLSQAGVKLDYLVGTMIETPRAALLADEVAEVCDFFSFGTNDLTQTTMALSRDDAGRFLPEYVNADGTGVFSADPFQSLDQKGVGMLVEMAVEKGRATDKKLKLGICGEHGGDQESIAFFHRVGLDYVSCSPFRVPIARLAAAKAAMDEHASAGSRSSKRRGGKPARGKKSATKRKPTAGKKAGKPTKARKAAKSKKSAKVRKTSGKAGTRSKAKRRR